MIPVSLKTVFARVISAFDQRDRGVGYVLSGGAPTAFGAASLRVDLSECIYVDSLGAPQRQVATNVTPGGASATLTRADLIYIAQGGGVAVVPGVGVIPSTTVPVIPPIIPANGTPLAIIYIGPGAVDYTDPTKAYIHDLRPFAVGPSMDNKFVNSDFSRRTAFGPAMPEVFADLLGTTKLDGGAAGAVAANIFTQGAANNEYAWGAGAFVWRDGRASATFKATAIAGIYELRWRVDATHYISVKQNNGNFTGVLANGGAGVVQVTTGSVLVINRWYWLDLEIQNQTLTVKLYDSGGTVPGVTKPSSTLLITLTVANLGWTIAGSHISITSDQAAAQWGGIAVGNGGVFVETLLPESLNITFSGTAGGQAIGIDQSADSGPIGKQGALRVYIPAVNRGMSLFQDTPIGSVPPNVTYTGSGYFKTAGKGGAGFLFAYQFQDVDAALGNAHTIFLVLDAGEVAWTRATGTAVTAATSRRVRANILINTGFTSTGTAYFMLPQLEQSPVATAWRSAPADDAPLTVYMATNVAFATVSAAFVEADSRALAANIFFPWDALVVGHVMTQASINGLVGIGVAQLAIDGADFVNNALDGHTAFNEAVANVNIPLNVTASTRVTAGYHRVAFRVRVTGDTLSIGNANRNTTFLITAYRGK